MSEYIVSSSSSVPVLLQTEEQAENLKKYAGLCPPGAIVELGSMTGKSAEYLLRGRKDPYLYPVFLFESNEHAYPRAKEVLAEYTHFVFIPAKSHFLEGFWHMPIALLHEDNGHTEESTLANLIEYGKWIRYCGYLILHDWDSPGWPGIKKAFDQWNLRYEFEEVLLCGPPERQQLILRRCSVPTWQLQLDHELGIR